MTRSATTRAWIGGPLVAAMVSVLLGSSPAVAQAGDEEEARALFVRGADAYRDERYAEALEAFEASYARRPVPVVLFNLAQTLRSLDRPAEAIETYRRYLREDPEPSPSRRAAVEAVVEELRPEVCLVHLEVFPDGAEVAVDDRVLGRAPFDGSVAVDPGERTFTARRDGYLARSETLTLGPGGEARVRLALPAEVATATLRLSVNVPARVRIDARDHGELDAPRDLELSAGAHVLELAADGYRDRALTVELEAREQRELHVDLEARERLWRRWWLWAAVGAVVVAGIVTVAVLASGDDPQPLEGTLPNVTALARFP